MCRLLSTGHGTHCAVDLWVAQGGNVNMKNLKLYTFNLCCIRYNLLLFPRALFHRSLSAVIKPLQKILTAACRFSKPTEALLQRFDTFFAALTSPHWKYPHACRVVLLGVNSFSPTSPPSISLKSQASKKQANDHTPILLSKLFHRHLSKHQTPKLSKAKTQKLSSSNRQKPPKS